MSSRARWVLLGACLLLRVVSLVRPCLSDDEAIYAVVAREMLRGRTLYGEIVDHKPPLIYATYAATQALAGPVGGMALLHLVTIVVVFATALLLAEVAGRLWPTAGGSVPAAAAFLYVLFTTTLFDFDALAANCELFMLLPLTASVALYVRGMRDLRPLTLAACGALVAAATFYKYQAAIHLPLYVVHLAFTQRRRPGRALGACAVLVAGFVAVSGACVALVATLGSGSGAWFWFRFNFAYIKAGLAPLDTVRRALVRVSFVVGVASFLWALGIREAARLLSRPSASTPEGPLSWLTAGWLAVSLAAITVGGRFFGHYFHQATAPLAVLAAPAAADLWRRRRHLVTAWVGVPVVAFFLVGVFHTRVMAAVGEPDPDYAAMAKYVGLHSGPRDPIVVWGNSPVLYFDAERPLGSRFVFSNYLTGMSPATATQTDPHVDASANIVPESWDMFAADMASRRPVLFVDLSAGNVAGYGKFPPRRFPRLEAILERDYVVLGEVEGGRILTRRADAAPATTTSPDPRR
jgi:hypothetical protein